MISTFPEFCILIHHNTTHCFSLIIQIIIKSVLHGNQVFLLYKNKRKTTGQKYSTKLGSI